MRERLEKMGFRGFIARGLPQGCYIMGESDETYAVWEGYKRMIAAVRPKPPDFKTQLLAALGIGDHRAN